MALDNFKFGKDLMEYVLKTGGQSTAATDDYAADVRSAIRKEYWRILKAEPWTWALSPTPGVLTTTAKTAVVVSSFSGATVTLSANLSPSQAGRKFYMDGNQSMYRITAHTSGTNTMTLDATYVDTPTGGNATIYQDEFAIDATAMRLWGPLNLRGQFEGIIDLINQTDFKARYGSSRVTAVGLTEVATEIRQNSAGAKQIQIAPWTEDQINIEYDFTPFHDLDFTGAGAGDTPHLRQEDRFVIAEYALWSLFRVKDDVIADSAWKRADKGYVDMVNAHISSSARSRMWSRRGASLGVGEF